MNQLQSHSSIGATSKRILLPSGWQLLLYMLASCLILFTLNIKTMWRYLNNTVIKPQGGLDQLLADKTPSIHKLLGNLTHSVILQYLFWLVVGCIIYILIWSVKNLAINLLNDVVADNYVHPKGYNRTKYWQSVIARKIFFGLCLGLLLTYVASGTKILFLFAEFTHQKLANFHASSLIQIALCVFATMLLIYVLILLLHTVVSSWRLIYKDL
jgi:hypothetical protein